MSEKAKEMICISCPIGCHLKVSVEKDGEVSVEGNRCPRGIEYGREEMLAPKRVVTATVALKGGRSGRVPVKTDAPLLKEHIPGLLDEIYRLELEAPVKLGTPLMENLYGTGVNLYLTRSIQAKKPH
jgi:CxxC motif-containing protein